MSGTSGEPDTPPVPAVVVAENVPAAAVREPTAAPSYNDQVRFKLAKWLLIAVGASFGLLVVLCAGGKLTVADAKELALTGVAMFGVVSPIVAFYFAQAPRD